MPITLAQNFYKETVAIAWATGAGNFYVSTKPTISSGYLVVSPNSASLREIVKFTATGTDGSGDYVTITAPNRGLGGTTEQAHAIGETVYINFTAENLQEISDAIDAIVAGGALDASTTTKGILKLSTAPASATNPIAVGDNDSRLPSTDLSNALAGGGVYGTPSSSNKFITQSYNSSGTGLPVVRTYLNAASPATWTKPTGLKYVVVEVQAIGGAGSSVTTSARGGGGGGGGGYSKKLIATAALGATETVTIGASGVASSFGSHCSANPGVAATANSNSAGAGGSATGGDINVSGQSGQIGADYSSPFVGRGGQGGDSILGIGGQEISGSNGSSAIGYGAGGGGSALQGSGSPTGGSASPAIVIVTEYYS